MATAAAAIPSFSDTYGAGIIGSWFAVALYGLTTSQVYLYFSEYPKDPLENKILVSVLWILHTAHSVFTCHAMYNYMIVSAFNLKLLSQNIWSLGLSVLMHLLVAILVTSYFIGIIFKATNVKVRWGLAGLNVVALLLHAGFGFETIVHMFRTKNLLEFHAFTQISIIPMTGTQVAMDVLLAVSLCLVLNSHRSQFNSTNSMVNKLMLYAVDRCVLTATAALVELLALSLHPDSMWYVGAEFTIVGLYSNSLLSSLNSRRRIREGSTRGGTGDYNLSNMTSSVHGRHTANHPAVITIDREVHVFDSKEAGTLA
ncbi:hypothetical protein FB451DRAFT_1313351 [Mycena latifolia]|nr:hypothetical protein FB451DRAFT_1313351 [Mycena latifolia]